MNISNPCFPCPSATHASASSGKLSKKFLTMPSTSLPSWRPAPESDLVFYPPPPYRPTAPPGAHIIEYTPPGQISFNWQKFHTSSFVTNARLYRFTPLEVPLPPDSLSSAGTYRGCRNATGDGNCHTPLIPPAQLGQKLPWQGSRDIHQLTFIAHIAWHRKNDWILFVAVDESWGREKSLVYVWWGETWRHYIHLAVPLPCTECDPHNLISTVFEEWSTWAEHTNVHWRKGEKAMRHVPSSLIMLFMHWWTRREPRRPAGLAFPTIYKNIRIPAETPPHSPSSSRPTSSSSRPASASISEVSTTSSSSLPLAITIRLP